MLPFLQHVLSKRTKFCFWSTFLHAGEKTQNQTQFHDLANIYLDAGEFKRVVTRTHMVKASLFVTALN